jgi:hypothetical protein
MLRNRVICSVILIGALNGRILAQDVPASVVISDYLRTIQMLQSQTL